MSRSTISTFQLFERFPDAESARFYLEGRLWPAGPVCPECKSGERITARKAGYYRCNACPNDYTFTVRTGTIFERSHVPLHKWVYAMYLLVTSRKGVSSLQMAKEIGVTQKTSWFMLQRLREACGSDPLSGGTLVKMAKKRAHIDAALTGTASSDLFTQDLEDLGPRGGRHDEPPVGDDGSRDEGRAETTRAPRPARTSGPKPSGLADRIVSFARSRGIPSAKAAEVLKSLGFASSKDVPEDKARAVFEALEAAAPKREPGSDDDDPFGKLHEDAIPENVGPQR